MALDITFLGHSGFIFSDGDHQLVVDPFLTGNPLAKHKPDEIECDYLALTHGHGDHLGDSVPILKRTGATAIAPYELCDYLGEQGIEKCEPGNPGGRIPTDFGHVAFTPALHSSSFEGRYMGCATGLVIKMGGVTVYHAGDTALFSDMALIGEVAKPKVACLPCGGRFNMTSKLAAKAAEMVKPQYAIPIHWKTFPMLTDDISDFQPAGVEVKQLEPGETWQVS